MGPQQVRKKTDGRLLKQAGREVMNLTIQQEENTDSICSPWEDGRKHPDTLRIWRELYFQDIFRWNLLHMAQSWDPPKLSLSILTVSIFVLIKATSSNNINFSKYKKNVWNPIIFSSRSNQYKYFVRQLSGIPVRIYTHNYMYCKSGLTWDLIFCDPPFVLHRSSVPLCVNR